MFAIVLVPCQVQCHRFTQWWWRYGHSNWRNGSLTSVCPAKAAGDGSWMVGAWVVLYLGELWAVRNFGVLRPNLLSIVQPKSFLLTYPNWRGGSTLQGRFRLGMDPDTTNPDSCWFGMCWKVKIRCAYRYLLMWFLMDQKLKRKVAVSPQLSHPMMLGPHQYAIYKIEYYFIMISNFGIDLPHFLLTPLNTFFDCQNVLIGLLPFPLFSIINDQLYTVWE